MASIGELEAHTPENLLVIRRLKDLILTVQDNRFAQ